MLLTEPDISPKEFSNFLELSIFASEFAISGPIGRFKNEFLLV